MEITLIISQLQKMMVICGPWIMMETKKEDQYLNFQIIRHCLMSKDIVGIVKMTNVALLHCLAYPVIIHISKRKTMNNVIDEETYLTINGASRYDIGDSALHKNKGNNSDKTWSKIVNLQAEKDRQLLLKREKLRKEYRLKVENGELRPPTRIERLISTANSHPDHDSTHAARRILEKLNINYLNLYDTI
jgi:hypothetical protein